MERKAKALRITVPIVLTVAAGMVSIYTAGWLFHAQWTAMGTVGHWGHIHTRQNQYEANITIDSVDGVWKITDLELLEEKRIDPYAQPNTSNSQHVATIMLKGRKVHKMEVNHG